MVSVVVEFILYALTHRVFYLILPDAIPCDLEQDRLPCYGAFAPSCPYNGTWTV